MSPASVQIAAADAAAHLTRDERAPPDPSRSPRTMVFATREEEIDYLRDELERAGYDESSNQKWDEATLGRVRKLKLLEEEAPRRRRADVYDDESGSDEEESDDEEEVNEQGICWSAARGPDMEEEEAEAPTRRRCAHVKDDGRQCGNPVLGANEKRESVHESNARPTHCLMRAQAWRWSSSASGSSSTVTRSPSATSSTASAARSAPSRSSPAAFRSACTARPPLPPHPAPDFSAGPILRP